jgi:hypothetical protein
MALTEKELERKTLSEIGRLIIGYEEKLKELAGKVKAGTVKPADMMALNSDLAMLKKAQDKKTREQNLPMQRGQTKSATPLKSYDDYLKSKN